MGIFGGSQKRNQKLVREVLKHASPKTTMVTCPRCGTRTTVTFLNSNDSVTCRKCGTRIYAQ